MKRFEETIHKKSYVWVLMLLSLLMISGCDQSVKFDFLGTELEEEVDLEESAGKSALGVRNYLQILETFDQLTGLSFKVYDGEDGVSSPANLRNHITFAMTMLPQTNDPSKVAPSNINTIAGLADRYCGNLIGPNRVYTEFFTGTTFETLEVEDLDSQEQNAELVDHYLEKFWGPALAGDEHRESSRNELIQLAEDLRVDLEITVQNLRLIMRGVCAAALASAPVVFF